MEDARKTGMSKGCIVALIIVAVLIVIIIIGGLTCWYYKDDLAKMAAATAVNGIKQTLAEGQVADVDTTQFNAMADAFLDRLDQDEQLNYERYGVFMQSLQQVVSREELKAEDVQTVYDAIVMYYPELEELLPTVEEEQPVGIEDTLSSQ